MGPSTMPKHWLENWFQKFSFITIPSFSDEDCFFKSKNLWINPRSHCVALSVSWPLQEGERIHHHIVIFFIVKNYLLGWIFPCQILASAAVVIGFFSSILFEIEQWSRQKYFFSELIMPVTLLSWKVGGCLHGLFASVFTNIFSIDKPKNV